MDPPPAGGTREGSRVPSEPPYHRPTGPRIREPGSANPPGPSGIRPGQRSDVRPPRGGTPPEPLPRRPMLRTGGRDPPRTEPTPPAATATAAAPRAATIKNVAATPGGFIKICYPPPNRYAEILAFLWTVNYG